MDEPRYGTPFIETEALLAASEGDDEELERLLGLMSETTRRELRASCQHLAARIRQFVPVTHPDGDTQL